MHNSIFRFFTNFLHNIIAYGAEIQSTGVRVSFFVFFFLPTSQQLKQTFRIQVVMFICHRKKEDVHKINGY